MLGSGRGRQVIQLSNIEQRLSSTYGEHVEDSSRCGHRVGSWIKGSLRFLLPVEHVIIHPHVHRTDTNSNLEFCSLESEMDGCRHRFGGATLLNDGRIWVLAFFLPRGHLHSLTFDLHLQAASSPSLSAPLLDHEMPLHGTKQKSQSH